MRHLELHHTWKCSSRSLDGMVPPVKKYLAIQSSSFCTYSILQPIVEYAPRPCSHAQGHQCARCRSKRTSK